jgi:hypothetical protein
MPASVLRLIQLGDENTWGTDTAATVRIMGVTDASFSQADEIESTGDLGNPMPSVAAVLKKTSGEGSITQRCSYQDIVYWLQGAFGVVSASAAASTTYAWKYAAPAATAAVTPEFYTIEYGEPTGAAYQLEGALVSEVRLSGSVDDGMWQAEVSFIGETIAAEAMTTGLSNRTVDVCRFADTDLYIDAWGGTLGSTPVAASLISAELRFSPGRHLKHFAGSVTPVTYGDSRWEGEMTLVLEFNSTVKAYVDALLAPAVVQKQIRLKTEQGTGTTIRTMQVDFAGTLVDGVKLFEDRDGNITISLKFNGTYHTTMATWLKFYVKNELGTMA